MEAKKHQAPIGIAAQIQNLKDKGLKIEDEMLAATFLNDVSYYRFIKAYSLGLKPRNGNYHKGVSFNQLKELYLFNANFRQLLFAQIEHIEVNLRCRISNYFSITYGAQSYYDSQYFSNSTYHSALMGDIEIAISKNKRSPFIRNFQENYMDGKIPLYALVEILSLGTLSKFFKNMKNADKKNVAKTFGVGYPYLESWIESLAYVRNICAHYGRLYNAKLAKTPKMYRAYKKDGIKNDRIFAILICMAHMLRGNTGWQNFVYSVGDLFKKYPHVQKETMGFPEYWRDLLQNVSSQ